MPSYKDTEGKTRHPIPLVSLTQHTHAPFSNKLGIPNSRHGGQLLSHSSDFQGKSKAQLAPCSSNEQNA